uniref:S8 family peptidase n=1 Tax=Schaalia odontolytica TaxID=1660 RepID=UPI003C73EF6C
ADDTITTQDYFSYYKLDSTRAKGYTGKGVTIAMIDGPVDTNAPELAGANITVKTPCEYEAANASRTHATAIASILVSKNYGLAPDATLIAYAKPSNADKEPRSCANGRANTRALASLIHMAINDGASIISYSSSAETDQEDVKWAIARAMTQGTIIAGSIGNESHDTNEASVARWSGTVGVSAIDTDGQLASYSSWGQGVVAAGIGGPINLRDYETGAIRTGKGTSYATPIVAGQIALARSRWPEATPNQILQLLTHSGLNTNNEWNQYTGYGALNMGAMMKNDPTQYPDENPLADKGGGSTPTPDDLQQYLDGRAPFRFLAIDDSYVYRGVDEDAPAREGITAHLGTSPAYHRK